MKLDKILLLVFVVILFSACNKNKSAENELNIYSSRKEEFLTELLNNFSKKYNIKVNVKNDTDVYKLIESMSSSQNSGIADPRLNPDLLITADVSSMNYAKEKKLLEKSSCELYKNIDKFFLDGECFWSAISFRARVIAYSKDRVSQEELKNLVNYLSLTAKDEKGEFIFKNRIIFTPISSPYNQFLIAYLLTTQSDAHKLNKDYNREMVTSWLHHLMNDTRRSNPSGTDTGKLEDIANGSGDLAMVNSYYYFRKILPIDKTKTQDELRKLGEDFQSKVGIIFPNQPNSSSEKNNGTSVNFSTVGIASKALHKKNAEKFIEFLLSDEAQDIISKNNHEYSVTLKNVNENLNKNATDKTVVFDMKTNLVEVSKNIKDALLLAEKNNWN